MGLFRVLQSVPRNVRREKPLCPTRVFHHGKTLHRPSLPVFAGICAPSDTVGAAELYVVQPGLGYYQMPLFGSLHFSHHEVAQPTFLCRGVRDSSSPCVGLPTSWARCRVGECGDAGDYDHPRRARGLACQPSDSRWISIGPTDYC